MALHADNAEDHAEQMIVLSQRLKGLVERETAHFEARTPHEATVYIDEKNKLATTYRLETARIAKNPSLMAETPTELRTALRDETLDLDKALKRNNLAAATVRKLTEGLVHAIADEATNTRSRMNGYGANGRVSQDDAAIAITLNRQV